MSDARLLGIDVGTTGCKAVLVDAAGTVRAEATCDYPLHTPRPAWSEQDPHDWAAACTRAIREVLERDGGARVTAVGLTGQMHGLVLLDAAGEVIRPAILWNDQRCGAQCEQITQRVGPRRVIELTGNPVLAGFTAPKIEWVRQNEPDAFARVAHVLLPKDYVRYRLTGELAGDVSDASGTSLFDVGRRRWSDEMLAALELPRRWLPDVAESPQVVARISPQAARQTGLPEGTPVVAGAGDQAAQAIGSGVVADGDACVTLGTSGVVFAACDTYRTDPQGRLHAFCHAAPDRWHLMGVVLSAGGSLRWLRDTLCDSEVAEAQRRGCDPYDIMTGIAERVPPGCEGLLFAPYLSGERTPHADPQARGAFVGLSLRHTRAHLIRSVLEGVAFALRDSLELIRQAGTRPGALRLSGGGARSRLWRQILADVLGCDLTTLRAAQGAACGAALLAGVGAGVFDSVEQAAATVRTDATIRPGDAQAAYDALYETYRGLYPALRDTFAALAAGPRAAAAR